MDEETPPAPSLSWLGDEVEEADQADRSPRRRVLLAAATLPWLVLAYVLLRPAAPAPVPQHAAGHAPSPATSATPEAAEHDTEDAQANASPTPLSTAAPSAGAGADAISSHIVASQARSVPGASEAGALAVLAARAWLTTAGPRPDIRGLPDGPPDVPDDAYLEHVAVEAVDWPAPGSLVVTLVVVVLRSEDGAYTDARLERLAVPVRLDRDGATLGGEPWWLEPPEPSTAAVEPTNEIDDSDLLANAAEAVSDAGIDGELTTLERTDGWPLLATVRRDGEQQRLWLRTHLDDLVVAGTLPPGPGRARGNPSPTSSGTPSEAGSQDPS